MQMAGDVAAALQAEREQLHRENTALRNSLVALQSEVTGARLAAKYLDKELAGRIQQLQLFGRDMKTDIRNKLWRQLEAEILLQRHKTVVRACRINSSYQQQQRVTSHNNNINNTLNTINNNMSNNMTTLSAVIVNGDGEATATVEPTGQEGQEAVGAAALRDQPVIRTVTVSRQPGEGLGMSVTGGREHGVPILISELEADGPAARTSQLYVGDAILAVNRVDLRQAGHKEAVALLSAHPGDVVLEVQFLASAEDSEDDNSVSGDLENFRYRFFDEDVLAPGENINLYNGYLDNADSDAVIPTPTAPRTPDSRNASEVCFPVSPASSDHAPQSHGKLSTIAVEVPLRSPSPTPSPEAESGLASLAEAVSADGPASPSSELPPVGAAPAESPEPGTEPSPEPSPEPSAEPSAAPVERAEDSDSVSAIQRILRTLTSASPLSSPSPSVSASVSPSASPATSTPVSPERRLRTHPGYALRASRDHHKHALHDHTYLHPQQGTHSGRRQRFTTLDDESFAASGEDGTQEIYRFRKPISDESQSEKMSDSGVAVTASGGSLSGSTSAYGSLAGSLAGSVYSTKPKQTRRRSKRSSRKAPPSDGAVSSPDSMYFQGRFVPSDAVILDNLGDPDFGTPV
ncbi:uncharacterized protein LOC117650808 [Thrips palmi]|uniref:Uncharacterized protein LOC117650808 n=1 Tax=Thrips palmi TaxID=161013 RepID=A0A6P8ZY12_THRPL|nr:uncharacterized protein LOC117650808 [Thrips palmi]